MATTIRSQSGSSRPLHGAMADFSLGEKYDRESGIIYLSGIQALVRLPLDQHRADQRQGLHTGTFISGYRGSPLGGIDSELDRNRERMQAHHVVHQPGLNEELAATAIFGSQLTTTVADTRYDGVLGIWYGKGPGVDRTGDVFRHANLAGVSPTGGVLALAGDDPSCKSSTIPSASESALADAMMPTLYPGNVQEVLDLGLHGFALSRASGCWAGMKIVTNVADSAGVAEVSNERIRPIIPIVEFDGKPYQHRPDARLLPPHSVELERGLHYARLEIARRYTWENKLNRIVVPTPDAWLGIMAAGKTYHDLRQALTELGLDDAELAHYGIRLLQMGVIYPVEPQIIREFARGVQEILVVEEKRAFLELFARDILYPLSDRPLLVGKSDQDGQPLVPSYGELDADKIARVVAARLARRLSIPSVDARIAVLDHQTVPPAPRALPMISADNATVAKPLPNLSTPVAGRVPYYCSGCPHNRSTQVPQGTSSLLGAGIGCHSMVVWMDPESYGETAGLTQMGGEGAQWIGMAPFTNTPHLFQNIGDGTYFHSGAMAVQFAIASGVNITYKLLYNSAVAMTGGQDAVGAIPIPTLVQRLALDGVKRTIITSDAPEKYARVTLPANTEVWHRDRLPEAHETLAKEAGVTVLLHDGQCATEKRRLRKRGKLAEPTTRVYINERVCEGCGDCGKKSNCLSVIPIETEFGRKTQIHQSSCNKDYSCLLGDCPSFLTIEGGTKPERKAAPAPPIAGVPEPTPLVDADGFAMRMMGIGGTGVVTTNQILGTAAVLDGLYVWSLDQTGLAQKGGAVVSDLKLSREPREAGKISAGGANLYLGSDLLVANDPNNLLVAAPDQTVAVVSVSAVPTGTMVTNTKLRFPDLHGVLGRIGQVTNAAKNVYLDAEATAHALFGDHMPANLILVGAAYQAGALPISAAAIERAIELNGTAVENSLAAFRWGRVAVADPGQLTQAVHAATTTPVATPPQLSAEAQQLIAASGATGRLQELLTVRVPDLIAYQDLEYATRYVGFVTLVREAEAQQMPEKTALSEAVAHYLYKLLAYKDEYEVARLHLDPAQIAAVREEFGPDAKITWRLHPPLLREWGMKEKLALGPWFGPGFQALQKMKRLRGTALDPFGRAEVRQVERALPGEYRAMIKDALGKLTTENYAQVVALAELPDLIRGYEQIKLDNVQRYHEAVATIQAQLEA